jgi:hypothetical protein
MEFIFFLVNRSIFLKEASISDYIILLLFLKLIKKQISISMMIFGGGIKYTAKVSTPYFTNFIGTKSCLSMASTMM